jgi:hypothetical protein
MGFFKVFVAVMGLDHSAGRCVGGGEPCASIRRLCIASEV